MRVSVFINDEAGGETEAREVVRSIQRYGHDIVRLVGKDDRLERLLEKDADAVVAGGGDGTIARVAKLMAGRAQPMAMLPLGTANNIATNLGCTAPVDELIRHWSQARIGHIDLGRVSGPFGERHFLESVGGGLVAETIALMDARPMSDALPPSWRIDRAIDGYLDELAEAEPQPWSLIVDAAEVRDDFLLVEVLNIASIGPRIVLSDRADPSDGLLTLVVARRDDRQRLMHYLHRRTAGDEPPLSLPSWTAREVVVRSGHGRMHIDDEVIDLVPESPVTVSIEPGAVRVLLGPASTCAARGRVSRGRAVCPR
ncbi:MAG: NAD(+)/NADH kinase [Acidobacteria bacterium]|nr:NAD(+)/NADH kinase [Acidobacteriota bacterium]